MKKPKNELLDFIYKEMPQYFDEEKHIAARAVYKIPPGEKRKNGAYNLSILEGKKGVYCIYEERPSGPPKVVYIGQSASDLYKTVTRHFQNWDSRSGNYPGRVSYRGSAQIGTGFFVEAYTDEKHMFEIEEESIMKLRPRDNNLKIFRYEKGREDKEAEKRAIMETGTRKEEIKDFSPPEEAEEPPF